jgi:aspartyl-tRNA(Asn)/glutamyl-tRNA(Gln) amidotransferase subunit A
MMTRWENYRLSVNRLFETYDFLVWPAAPTVAPRHGETLDEEVFWRAIAYTMPLSLTASPVLVVPVGIASNGMPITVQIVAASWADESLLAFGRALQEDDGDARGLIEQALAIPTRV